MKTCERFGVCASRCRRVMVLIPNQDEEEEKALHQTAARWTWEWVHDEWVHQQAEEERAVAQTGPERSTGENMVSESPDEEETIDDAGASILVLKNILNNRAQRFHLLGPRRHQIRIICIICRLEKFFLPTHASLWNGIFMKCDDIPVKKCDKESEKNWRDLSYMRLNKNLSILMNYRLPFVKRLLFHVSMNYSSYALGRFVLQRYRHVCHLDVCWLVS